LTALACGALPAHALDPVTAFFYGKPVPLELFSHYERVVLEADNLDDAGVLSTSRAKVYAYLSVGELEGWREEAIAADPALALGWSTAWNNVIADLTHPGWRSYVLDQRMSPLWERGFRGFFLDTLDSYQAATRSPGELARQRQALVEFIHDVHRRFPGVGLLLNRGFELLPQVAPLVEGVVAESMFRSFDPESGRFYAVRPEDSQWLIAQLQTVKQRYGLAVTVIDYLPDGGRGANRSVACDLVKRIASLGFASWISTPRLDVLGVSTVQARPQRLLILFHGGQEGYAFAKARAERSRDCMCPGHSLEYQDLDLPLPDYPLINRYAGIVTELIGAEQEANVREWLHRQQEQGISSVELTALCPAHQECGGLEKIDHVTESCAGAAGGLEGRAHR
jgi:hypothetical protein